MASLEATACQCQVLSRAMGSTERCWCLDRGCLNNSAQHILLLNCSCCQVKKKPQGTYQVGEVPREGCDCTESGHQTQQVGAGHWQKQINLPSLICRTCCKAEPSGLLLQEHSCLGCHSRPRALTAPAGTRLKVTYQAEWHSCPTPQHCLLGAFCDTHTGQGGCTHV